MMHSAMATSQLTHHDFRLNTKTWEQARSWIGCRLVLRKPFLGFPPDLECIVMCVVDFGEGCLLWVSSDDKLAREIGQIEVHEVLNYFDLSPSTEQRNITGMPL